MKSLASLKHNAKSLLGARVPPADRPAEVVEASERWKDSERNRVLLAKLITVAAERTAKAWESWQGVSEQLAHMSGDGRSAESAFLVNVADAQRQCADCLAPLKDALTHQARALREIDKCRSPVVKSAKGEFKRAEEAVQKAKRDRDKRMKSSGAKDERDDDAIATLHGTMMQAAAALREALDGDRKAKAMSVAQVLYAKYEAELSYAVECHDILSSSMVCSDTLA